MLTLTLLITWVIKLKIIKAKCLVYEYHVAQSALHKYYINSLYLNFHNIKEFHSPNLHSIQNVCITKSGFPCINTCMQAQSIYSNKEQKKLQLRSTLFEIFCLANPNAATWKPFCWFNGFWHAKKKIVQILSFDAFFWKAKNDDNDEGLK